MRCCRCRPSSGCRRACSSRARCSPRRCSHFRGWARGCATRSSTGTTRSCRAGSCSSRSSSSLSTCPWTSRTRSSIRGSATLERHSHSVPRMSVAEIEAAEIALEAPTGGLWKEASYRLIRNPAAIAGGILVLIFVIAAIFAPLIAPYGPLDQNLSLLKSGGIPPGPSWHHLLGVDLLGRDVFTRILYGARFSLLIGVVSVAIGLSVGLVLGSIAGYIGGIVESVIMRCMDVMLAIPGLLFAIGIVALLGPGLYQIMIAVGVVNIPIFARLLRGSVLAQRENDFVLAARAVGVRRRVILFSHIL